MSKCQSLTKKNLPCQNRVKPGSPYCGIHQSCQNKNTERQLSPKRSTSPKPPSSPRRSSPEQSFSPKTTPYVFPFLSLPSDLQLETAYFLPYETLINFCKSNDILNQKYCQNYNFWRKKAEKQLGVNGIVFDKVGYDGNGRKIFLHLLAETDCIKELLEIFDYLGNSRLQVIKCAAIKGDVKLLNSFIKKLPFEKDSNYTSTGEVLRSYIVTGLVEGDHWDLIKNIKGKIDQIDILMGAIRSNNFSKVKETMPKIKGTSNFDILGDIVISEALKAQNQEIIDEILKYINENKRYFIPIAAAQAGNLQYFLLFPPKEITIEDFDDAIKSGNFDFIKYILSKLDVPEKIFTYNIILIAESKSPENIIFLLNEYVNKFEHLPYANDLYQIIIRLFNQGRLDIIEKLRKKYNLDKQFLQSTAIEVRKSPEVQEYFNNL